MKKIIIDFTVLDTRDKFYDYISGELGFPEWSGRNADALHDLLSEERELGITVKNISRAGEWAAPVIAVLEDLGCAAADDERKLPPVEDMKRSDFWYDLPEELIAQTPIEPRDHSRLLKLDRQSGETEHCRFYELGKFLKPGDLLVMNDSRVLPARLFGVKDTGAVGDPCPSGEKGKAGGKIHLWRRRDDRGNH